MNTANFKTFYYDQLVNESPILTHNFTSQNLDNLDYNREYFENELKAQKIKKIDEWSNSGLVYEIYYSEYTINDQPRINYLLTQIGDINQTIIKGDFSCGLLPKNGIEETGVWKDKTSPVNLMKSFYIDWLLNKNKYNYIISDQSHTHKGQKFWKGLADIVLNDPSLKLSVAIYDKDNNKYKLIHDSNQLLQYYGDYNAEKRIMLARL